MSVPFPVASANCEGGEMGNPASGILRVPKRFRWNTEAERRRNFISLRGEEGLCTNTARSIGEALGRGTQTQDLKMKTTTTTAASKVLLVLSGIRKRTGWVRHPNLGQYPEVALQHAGN